MSTGNVSLDTSQYVRVNAGQNAITLQAHRDRVRIVFSIAKPAITNSAFHTMEGGEPVWQIPATDTNTWVLALTDTSSMTVTEYPNAEIKTDAGRHSAFGDLITVTPEQIVDLLPTNGLTSQMTVNTFDTGTVTTENGMFKVSTGKGQFAFASLLSDSVPYRCGLGIRADFTFQFTSGVVDSQQLAGFITSTDGPCFAYDELDDEGVFGIMRRHHGENEIQELQFTAGASGAETVVIRINGVNYNVNLTSGTPQFNANEAVGQLEGVVPLFQFTANDDTLLIFGQVSRPSSGTYTFTPDGGGTAAATFTQITAGAQTQEEFIPQSEWNIDTMSGLDVTKIQVSSIFVQYLGAGNQFFALEDTDTGAFKLVHMIKYAGKNTEPSLADPNMRIGLTAANLGNTTDLIVRSASMGGFIDGPNKITHDPIVLDNEVLSVGTSYVNLLTIRNRRVRGVRPNRIILHIRKLYGYTDSVKGASIRVIRNGTLTGTPDFQYYDKDLSIVEYDTDATGVTGGVELEPMRLDTNGIGEINGILDIHVHPGETVTLNGVLRKTPTAALEGGFILVEAL